MSRACVDELVGISEFVNTDALCDAPIVGVWHAGARIDGKRRRLVDTGACKPAIGRTIVGGVVADVER